MEDVKMVNANELFKQYDEIINVIMVNLYSLSKEKGKIILSNLDKRNRDHLLILRVALIAKDVYNFPLFLNVKWWDSLALNWRMRKLSRRVPHTKETEGCTNVVALLEFMYPPIKQHMGENFEFAHIYNSFYGKELD